MNLKIRLIRHFAHPSANFYTGEKSEIWSRFSTSLVWVARVSKRNKVSEI